MDENSAGDHKRWKFLDHKIPEEKIYGETTLKAIDQWWLSFTNKQGDISSWFKNQNWDLHEWVIESLHLIHPDLMWEFGPAIYQNGNRLVITPEVRLDLRPLLTTILERAPKLKGWEFYPYRQPEKIKTAIEGVKGRTKIDVSSWKFQATATTVQKIVLNFFPNNLTENNEKIMSDAAFVATEEFLGEEILDKWIGVIEVEKYPPVNTIQPTNPDPATSEIKSDISNLKKTVDYLKIQMINDLPKTTYREFVKNAKWSLFSLNPKEKVDYPNRSDLFTWITCKKEMAEAFFGGWGWYSECWSKHGEIFCFLKTDGSDGWDEEFWVDRVSLEDSLNKDLEDKKLGCVIGGGSGLRYSYVDFSIENLNLGIESIIATLKKGKIHKRSWILFFDPTLANEWIGVYDDTPPPPFDQKL